MEEAFFVCLEEHVGVLVLDLVVEDKLGGMYGKYCSSILLTIPKSVRSER